MAQPPNDAISSLNFAPGSSHRLIASSWDKNVHLYEIVDEGSTKFLGSYEHAAPVLDACFGATENEAFSAGLDCQVKRCVGRLPVRQTQHDEYRN